MIPFSISHIPHKLHTLYAESKLHFSNSVPYMRNKNVPFQYVTHSVPIPYLICGIKNVPFQYVTHSVPIPYQFRISEKGQIFKIV